MRDLKEDPEWYDTFIKLRTFKWLPFHVIDDLLVHLNLTQAYVWQLSDLYAKVNVSDMAEARLEKQSSQVRSVRTNTLGDGRALQQQRAS